MDSYVWSLSRRLRAEREYYALAAISPAGYRLADIPAAGETAKIELQPVGRLASL